MLTVSTARLLHDGSIQIVYRDNNDTTHTHYALVMSAIDVLKSRHIVVASQSAVDYGVTPQAIDELKQRYDIVPCELGDRAVLCETSAVHAHIVHGQTATLDGRVYSLNFMPPPWRLPAWLTTPGVYTLDSEGHATAEPEAPLSLRVACLCVHRPEPSAFVATLAHWVWTTPSSDSDAPQLSVEIIPFSRVDDSDHLLERCECDVMFLDGDDAATLWRHWDARYGSTALRCRIPCTCDPDAFIVLAGVNRDTRTGKPIVYRSGVSLFAATGFRTSGAVLKMLLMKAAHDRVQWIAERRILHFAVELARLTGMDFSQTLHPSSSALTDAMIERVWQHNWSTLPAPVVSDFRADGADDHNDAGDADDTFQGGRVLPAKLGIHRRIVLLVDARSLYPSVTREYRLDPLLAPMFEWLINERRRCAATDPLRALVLKLIANKAFGTRKYGLYHNIHTSADIARCGRDVLQDSEERMHALKVDILGGDTDALFIAPRGQPESLDAFKTEVLRILNAGREYVEFACDKIFDTLVLINRKCYFAHEYGASSGAPLIVKGLHNVKSDTCAMATRIHEEWQRAVYERKITTRDEHDEFMRQAVLYAQQSSQPLHDFSAWPKPTRKHMSTQRATCAVQEQPDKPYAEVVDLCNECAPIDLEHVFDLQVERPLHRAVDVLFPSAGVADA